MKGKAHLDSLDGRPGCEFLLLAPSGTGAGPVMLGSLYRATKQCKKARHVRWSAICCLVTDAVYACHASLHLLA